MKLRAEPQTSCIYIWFTAFDRRNEGVSRTTLTSFSSSAVLKSTTMEPPTSYLVWCARNLSNAHRGVAFEVYNLDELLNMMKDEKLTALDAMHLNTRITVFPLVVCL